MEFSTKQKVEEEKSNINKKLPLSESIKKKILYWIRLTNDPVVKVYHGYGNEKQLVVFGHVFDLGPIPRKKYKKNIWTNTLSLAAFVYGANAADATVRITWNDKIYRTKTA